MSAGLSQEKQQVHEMIERLAPGQLTAVRGLLEMLLDPVAPSFANAPVEDEEITREMAAVLDRARASIERGEGIPHEDILREFGLTPRP
ncbi:MAG TPA: hypothetical protein VK687_00260 [Bryobacteraceae bacterium]|nr:hypothetical protein [Bryobacteraceae bacterium]